MQNDQMPSSYTGEMLEEAIAEASMAVVMETGLPAHSLVLGRVTLTVLSEHCFRVYPVAQQGPTAAASPKLESYRGLKVSRSLELHVCKLI